MMCRVIVPYNIVEKDENGVKMSSTTIFDFYVGIVCTFESSQIAASGGCGAQRFVRINVNFVSEVTKNGILLSRRQVDTTKRHPPAFSIGR